MAKQTKSVTVSSKSAKAAKVEKTVLVGEAAAEYKKFLADKAAAAQRALDEAERKATQEKFKSLLPNRTDDENCKLMLSVKPTCSIRALHPEYGIIEGIVCDTVPVYVRKGEKRGTLLHTEIDIASTTSYEAEDVTTPAGESIMRQCHVFSVLPIHILHVGKPLDLNLPELKVAAEKKSKTAAAKTPVAKKTAANAKKSRK